MVQWLREETCNREVVDSNPGAEYQMEIITYNEGKNKGSQMGNTKKPISDNTTKLVSSNWIKRLNLFNQMKTDFFFKKDWVERGCCLNFCQKKETLESKNV